jgi:DNA-binding transcriptional ArsR family regulator
MIPPMEYSRTAMDDYRPLADLHKALAHPVRLRILDLLARREACVCHLTAVLGMRQPYVSQQLGALRDAGAVVARREGTLIYYSLRDARLAALLALGQSLVGMPSAGFTPGHAGTEGPVPGCQCPSCHARATAADRRDPVSAPAHVTG